MSQYIENEIGKLIQKYNTNNPKNILKDLGITILSANLGGVTAHKITSNRITIITKDYNLDEYQERFVLAHELGHVILHRGQSTTFYRSYEFGNAVIPKIEREANEFATKLLLYDQNYDNKYEALKENGIPYEMERFI